MDLAVIEMLQIIRLRAELLAILRSADADLRLKRWLMLRRSFAMRSVEEPTGPRPRHYLKRRAPIRRTGGL
jgi:hypothetical protein